MTTGKRLKITTKIAPIVMGGVGFVGDALNTNMTLIAGKSYMNVLGGTDV